MPRVRRGAARSQAKKSVFKRAKGFVGGRSKLYRTVMETVLRAEAYATRDRRQRKRNFRSLWITRVGAAVRQRDMSYNQFMAGLKKSSVELNRKLLAALAVEDPAVIDALVDIARQGMAK